MYRTKLTANLMISIILVGLVINASVSAQSTIPVQGAFVSASGTNGSGSDTTDSQGRYNITTFLDTGNYTVSASATGYIDSQINNIAVTAGAETTNVNIVMPVSGGISGKITDAVSGQPALAFVTAYNATGSSETGPTAYTDPDGNYQIITNLPTGTYNVSATFSSGHIYAVTTGVLVTAGAMTSNVNIALGRSATITGTVKDSVSQTPLPDVFVCAIDASGTTVAFTSTNSSGIYVLNTDMPTGTYNVSAPFPEGHLPKTVPNVSATAGSTTTQNILLDPSGIISGRVTSATGQGLSGASIIAMSGSFMGSATTNSSGYYRVTDGLGTGSYMVYVYYGTSFTFITGVSVVQGQETPNVNFALSVPPTGTITGKVTNSTGSPIAYASVTAQGIAGSGSATTDSNGNYTITGLATGTYTVNATATGFYSQTQTGVSVTAGQTTPNINFQLSAKASGRISGTVTTLGVAIPEYHSPTYVVVIFAFAATAVVLMKIKSARAQARHNNPKQVQQRSL